jgi:hypothetical protein
MWRQASLPAVEGGILPPGKTWPGEKLNRPNDFLCGDTVPPGWKPRLYVSQDG